MTRERDMSIIAGSREICSIHRHLLDGDVDPADLRRFRRHGFVLPRGCQEVTRLPDEFGTSSIRMSYIRSPAGDRQTLLALSVTSGGEPCMIAQTLEGVMLRMGDGEQLWTIVERGAEMSIQSARIIAHVKESMITVVQILDGASSTIRMSSIFVGPKLVNKVAHLTAAALLGSGAIMYATEVADEWLVFLEQLRLDEAISRNYKDFFLYQGQMFGLWTERPGFDMDSFGRIGHQTADYSMNGWMHAMVSTHLGLEIITLDPASAYLRLVALEGGLSLSRELGRNPYLGGFRELGNDLCYVGKTSRDNLECQVVNGEEQPSFTKVSPAFSVDEDTIGYYGELDGHLFLIHMTPKRPSP